MSIGLVNGVMKEKKNQSIIMELGIITFSCVSHVYVMDNLVNLVSGDSGNVVILLPSTNLINSY